MNLQLSRLTIRHRKLRDEFDDGDVGVNFQLNGQSASNLQIPIYKQTLRRPAALKKAGLVYLTT